MHNSRHRHHRHPSLTFLRLHFSASHTIYRPFGIRYRRTNPLPSYLICTYVRIVGVGVGRFPESVGGERVRTKSKINEKLQKLKKKGEKRKKKETNRMGKKAKERGKGLICWLVFSLIVLMMILVGQ